jgi:hypothetical protein
MFSSVVHIRYFQSNSQGIDRLSQSQKMPLIQTLSFDFRYLGLCKNSLLPLFSLV